MLEWDDLIEVICCLWIGIFNLNWEVWECLLVLFEVVNGYFQRLFMYLFGGGIVELQLVDLDDLLDVGLEIIVCLFGKKL